MALKRHWFTSFPDMRRATALEALEAGSIRQILLYSWRSPAQLLPLMLLASLMDPKQSPFHDSYQ